MKKYFVSCTTYYGGEEQDSMYTFDANNVDEFMDKLLAQVASEGKEMGKVVFLYSESRGTL